MCKYRVYRICGTATCETELINLIRQNQIVKAGGRFYNKTVKDKMGKANKLLAYSFWFYNKGGELLKRRSRQKKMKVESPVDPIDPIEIPYLQEAKKRKNAEIKRLAGKEKEWSTKDW